MRKKLISIFLGIAMILAAIPGGLTYAEDAAGLGGSGTSAEETVIAPTITIEDSTTYTGSYGTIYVNGSDFANVAGLKISVVYDSSVITVTDAYKGSLVGEGSDISDINCKVDGQVTQSITSLDGINGTGTLMSINYIVKSGAEADKYSLLLVVEEAYSLTTDSTTGKSTPMSITVNKKNGKLIIKEQEQTAPVASFSASTTKSNLQQGDTFDYVLSASSIGNLAGGNFEFSYDRDVLELSTVTLGSSLEKSTVTSSMNTGTAGLAKVSFIATETLNASSSEKLVTLSFTVKADVDESTAIDFSPTGLQALTYGEDSMGVLTAMTATGLSSSVNITKKEVEVTYPRLSLVYAEIEHGQTFSVTAVLDGDSKLAAGDFTVNYDKDACVCTGVEACTNEASSEDDEVQQGTSLIVTNPKFSDGTVKFSFLNTSGISADVNLVKMTFKILKQSGEKQITATGSSVVDVNRKAVTLEYPSLTVNLSHCLGEWTTVKEATFEEDGQMQAKCSGCDYVATKTIPKHLYGDVNRDGEVNFFDAIFAKRYLAGWEGYQNIDTLALDVNCDGNENSDDVKADITILERHIAGWNDYKTLPWAA